MCHRKFPDDVSALLLGDLYYTQLSLSGVSDHLSHSALQELYEMLHANLSSNISKVGQTDQQQMRIDRQYTNQVCVMTEKPHSGR